MRYFNEQWNINLSPSTVSEMLKNRDKYFDSDNLRQSETKRLRLCENPELEKALYLWLSNVTAHNISVSDEMLKEKARHFGELLGVSSIGFKYSNCWLEKFKNRHNIKLFSTFFSLFRTLKKND